MKCLRWHAQAIRQRLEGLLKRVFTNQLVDRWTVEARDRRTPADDGKEQAPAAR